MCRQIWPDGLGRARDSIEAKEIGSPREGWRSQSDGISSIHPQTKVGGKMRIRFLAVVLLFLVAGSAFAQGVTTATLEGTVKGPDGAGLPGVTVSVKSPALMGQRSTVTSAGGDCVLKGLPPGAYTITFTLEGMSAQTKKQNLALGLPTR